jgi:uncharacterized phage-associated protein
MDESKHFEFDSEKFQELVLYLAKRSETDDRFGSTKLNKLLYYIDTRSYLELGSPMTGAMYRHLRAGPAPYELLKIRSRLIDAGHAHLEYRPYFNHMQDRLVADREPKLSLFSSEELEIVDSVISQLWDYNGAQLSAFSHLELGWQITEENEEIPYELAFISSGPLSLDQIEMGKRIAGTEG